MAEYEVESIRAFRIGGDNRQYLVHWKGYDDDSDTWEPEENVSNAQLLVDQFWEGYKYEEEPMKLTGISTLLYNGEIVYLVDYGDEQSIVTKEYLSKYYPKDLMKFLSG